jgi:hypothetical protein
MPRGGLSVDKVSTLKIDRDCFVDSEWRRNYVRIIIAICKMFNVKVKSIKMSRSKKKDNHFYVEISPSLEANFANQLSFRARETPSCGHSTSTFQVTNSVTKISGGEVPCHIKCRK